MLDLALTVAVCVILLLAGGVTVYGLLAMSNEEVMAASTGTTGAISLGLICFSGMLLLGMMLS